MPPFFPLPPLREANNTSANLIMHRRRSSLLWTRRLPHVYALASVFLRLLFLLTKSSTGYLVAHLMYFKPLLDEKTTGSVWRDEGKVTLSESVTPADQFRD